jgi:hypothetical protein
MAFLPNALRRDPKRSYFAVGILSLTCATFLLIFDERIALIFFGEAGYIQYRILFLLGTGVLIVGIGFMLMSYLSLGVGTWPFKRDQNLDAMGEAVKANYLFEELRGDQEHAIGLLRTELNKLRGEVAKTARASALTDKDRAKLEENLKFQLASELSPIVLDMLEKKYSDKFKQSREVAEVAAHLNRICDRLGKEIQTLGLRSNVSLIIGVMTTGIAVYILIDPVLNPDSILRGIPSGEDQLKTALAYHFAPRIALSLFIEVFSFFFLRLYRAGLSEIKYFQNEITNVGIKFAALQSAIQSKDAGLVKEVVSALGKTERNFILNKGQTTADLERQKLDSQAMHDSLVTVRSALDRMAK